MQLERNAALDANELNTLLDTNQWDVQPVERLQAALTCTWGWVTARADNGQLIGFVRVLSDGLAHAYILQMIVHPDHRKQGVGTAIMRELMALLGEHRLQPTLVATPGNVAFYQRFGFATEMAGLTALAHTLADETVGRVSALPGCE